jgi:DNA-binding NarL/FixJ family response regulator
MVDSTTTAFVPAANTVKILIADDNDILRRSLRSFIECHVGWVVCGEAVDGRDAVEKAANCMPDVILLDVSMPNLDGFEAARRIRLQTERARIIFVTQHESHELAVRAAQTGAQGYISKSQIIRDLVPAVEAAARQLVSHSQFKA